MKIAITGGTGFIGRHLTKSLIDAGHTLKVLTRAPHETNSNSSRLVYLYGDLSVESSLDAFVQDVDILFHCAGEVRSVAGMEDLHIQGTQRLINVAAGSIKRWVQLSSTGVYGFPRSGIIVEDSVNKPQGVYEITKSISDSLVTEASKRGAFECVILRPSVVFGADMPNQSLFSLLKIIESNKFFYIGSPGASANYIHVKNVVDALKLCAFSPRAAGAIYNLSDYSTWEDFVGMFAQSLGVRTPLLRAPELPIRLLATLLQKIPGWPLKPSRVDALTTFVKYSDLKIRQELGYSPCISIENAIADLVRGYRRWYELKKN